jgi:hypothetical protein
LRWVLAVSLLFLGALLAQWLLPEVDQRLADLGAVWPSRTGDLAILLGIIFAGALGIRALLPAEGKED